MKYCCIARNPRHLFVYKKNQPDELLILKEEQLIPVGSPVKVEVPEMLLEDYIEKDFCLVISDGRIANAYAILNLTRFSASDIIHFVQFYKI